MLKTKSDSTKTPDNSKTLNSPIVAWSDQIDNFDPKVNKEKSSRFSMFKLKSKKNVKKDTSIPFDESQIEIPCLNNAFNMEIKSKNNRNNVHNDGKTNDESNILEPEDGIIIYPLTVNQNQCCNKPESESVNITVVSSDEYSINDGREFGSSKIHKQKKKVKKKKETIEISDVIYFSDEVANGKSSQGERDFPWTPISYNPESNEDAISNDFLNIFQLINILNHPIYKSKTVLIDQRIYDQYRKNPIFGAKHISEFQHKDIQLSFEKVKDENCSIVVLLFPQCKNNIDMKVAESFKILNLEYDSEIKEQSLSFLSNPAIENSISWMSFTCFDLGCIFLSENFEQSLKYLPDLSLDSIVTDCKTKIYHRFSEINCNNTPNIVSIASNQITNGEYSEKLIMNTPLMGMLERVEPYLDREHRSIIIFEDDDLVSITILILILMYKNRWSLQDTIACIKFVRCQLVNIKPIYLSILKNFEKLFFGKRLYSGGSKSKLNKEFAFEL